TRPAVTGVPSLCATLPLTGNSPWLLHPPAPNKISHSSAPASQKRTDHPRAKKIATPHMFRLRVLQETVELKPREQTRRPGDWLTTPESCRSSPSKPFGYCR